MPSINVSGINLQDNKTGKHDPKSMLTSLGIPADVISKGPESVKAYAEENGITLPKPPEHPDKNKPLFSAKKHPTGNMANPPNMEDMASKLTALGIPSDTISQGPQSVKEYAEKNNITLPSPPAKPSGSGNIDFTS